MRARLLLAALAAAVIAAPAAWAGLAEHAVIATPRNENNVAADWNGADEVLAWGQSRAGHPKAYDAWARVGAGPAIKLNAGGTAWVGGIDYPLVAYQSVRNRRADISLYDLSNDTRPATPAGVNTRKWEWHPTISGDWLLFGRIDGRFTSIVLHNMTTGEERVLDRGKWRRLYLQPDRVNGNWATYTRCPRACNVIRYDIAAGTKTTLPRRGTRFSSFQYSSSVTSAGVVYLVRSGRFCGRNVKIVRFFGPGDPATGTVLAGLARGKDTYGFYSYARENADGSVDLFYDRAHCRSGKTDIYKVTDPAPGP
jgi:hypothetical protein